MKKFFLLLAVVTSLVLLIFLPKEHAAMNEPKLWSVEAIDTMKYSRDPSREKLNDPAFDLIIATQVQNIAKIGATHVAIATPYDEEFVPILKRWVEAARRNHLKVWFRGNLSGWEQWFGYPKITREQHETSLKAFILKHPELFENGDIFMGCPECENGGPGDPRQTGDVQAYRKFLIDEHALMTDAFKQIGKIVNVDYNSMNGDVARLVMDKPTTKALGGTVVIDHYVKTPDQLVQDVQEIARSSGGNVILGEYGAPILDIHGSMTEDQQAQWVRDALSKLVTVPELTGVNYWVNVGGSTRLYNDDGNARKVVGVVTSFYNPRQVSVLVNDPLGTPVQHVTVTTLSRSYGKNADGVVIPVIEPDQRATVRADGYDTHYISVPDGQSSMSVTLIPLKENFTYKLRTFVKFLFRV